MDRIVDEYEMVTIIENFINSDIDNYVVGAPVGTSLIHLILKTVIRHCSLDKIMIIDCIRDYTLLTEANTQTMLKKNPNYRPAISRIHYSSFGCYISTPNSLEGNQILCGREGYQNMFLCNEKMKDKHFAIILDAHTIPKEELDALVDKLDCKSISVVDPYDIGGESYYNIPIIHETYCHMSPHVIFARNLYGIPSVYATNSKRYDYKVEKIKSLTRTIGAQPKYTYVSNSQSLFDQVDERQRKARPAKNHRFIIDDPRYREIYPGMISDGNTLLVVDRIEMNGNVDFRVWNDSRTFKHPFVVHPVSSEIPLILKPADLISPEMCTHHRFKTVCLVIDKNHNMTNKELYSIFKSCREIVVMEYK